MRQVGSLVLMLVGGLLVAMGILNLPAANYAVFLEWAGCLLAFAGISPLLGAKFAFALASLAFIAGSVGDPSLIKASNMLGWTLTNYMVYIHSLTGILTGKYMKCFRKYSMAIVGKVEGMSEENELAYMDEIIRKRVARFEEKGRSSWETRALNT